ncbi:MAG: hypothetical protein HKN19_07165 [Halioglobus sp.]|nr:hypothetical protein [Halioglobus sp.]
MARYDRVILHAGLSKTGSTTLQAVCSEMRPQLAAQGIHYPEFTFAGQPFPNHSIPMTAALTGSATRFGLRLQERFTGQEEEVVATCRAQFRAALAEGEGNTLLLSSEIAEGYGPRVAGDLFGRLRAAADEVRVVAYVRNPVSALASLLQERARAGSTMVPEGLVGRTREKCERLEKHFGDALTLLNYHEASSHRAGLVGAWFEWLGLDGATFAASAHPPRNTRLSAEAYHLIAAINQRYPLTGATVPRRAYDLDCLQSLPGQRFEVPGFYGTHLESGCREEAAWLEAHCGMRFPPTRSAPDTIELWGAETLAALPAVFAAVAEPALRRALAEVLLEEAEGLRAARPDTCAALAAIAREAAAQASA